MEISERILKVMEDEQLSPSLFADEIGVPRSSISHIISGRNKVSLDFLLKVKEHFPHLSWDWLIDGRESAVVPKLEEKVEEKPAKAQNLFSEAEAQPTLSRIPEEKPEQKKESQNSVKDFFGSPIDSTRSSVKQIILIYEDDSFKILHPGS